MRKKKKTIKKGRRTRGVHTNLESVFPQYNHERVEAKWQTYWEHQRARRPSSSRSEGQGCYILSMFPYPSGSLHIGHVRVYTISDCAARVERMRGKDVLHPMGWDAFGLPAENAATEHGIDPAKWTHDNIQQMKNQLKKLGMEFSWDTELTTCMSDYYTWTQWIFLRLYKAGLAYQAEALVNWDPVDGTVLANEQVDQHGRSWRSGGFVERRMMKQWFFRVTAYAEEMLSELDHMHGWPSHVKNMQASWIGRSSGTLFTFSLENSRLDGSDCSISVFTTRADTVFGVTYLVLAPEHPCVHKLTCTTQRESVLAYQKQASRLNVLQRTSIDKPKDGVATGGHVLHPFTREPLPVYISSYVLMEHGTGAVMGVPAHDERDFAFAKAVGLHVKHVVTPVSTEGGVHTDTFLDEGILVDSGEFTGMTTKEAISAITHRGEELGVARAHVQYRLRDWIVSRQRYWGAPIPIVHCDSCGAVPVPESELPVLLPHDAPLTGKGGSPLEYVEEWVRTACPWCGGWAKRDTDTMDTFVDSSWYFLRFTDPHNRDAIFNTERVNQRMPVDLYIGGTEHAIMHLLYARFITRFLHKEGLVAVVEPFRELLTQGLVLGRTYRNIKTGKYLAPTTVDTATEGKAVVERATGESVDVSLDKMSKSKHNGVDPLEVVHTYGADTLRLFLLFCAPPGNSLVWDTTAMEGQRRWLFRLWDLVCRFVTSRTSESHASTREERDLQRTTHETIFRVTEAVCRARSYNTAIAELMKLSNTLATTAHTLSNTTVYLEALQALLRMLAPMAPHIAAELWCILLRAEIPVSSHEPDVHQQSWPVVNTGALTCEEVTIVIQVKGKFRGVIQVPADVANNADEIERRARASTIGRKYVGDRTVRKVVIPRGRGLVNFVL